MASFGRLRVADGDEAGRVLDLEEGSLPLGRDPRSRLHLADPTVSKDQAVFHCGPDGVSVENRSPRNPILVNDEPVEGRRRLRAGDRLTAGSVNLLFEDPRAASPPAAGRAGAEEPGSGPSGTRMMLQPFLILHFPGGVTREETLAGTRVTVGRATDSDIVVEFPTVSGRHAEIELRDGKYRIVDVGSTNGTSVNGKRIEAPHPLRNGDIVRIGDISGNSVSLTFREEGADIGQELGTVAIGRLQVEGRDTFVLGRDPACEVPLEGGLVSFRHARVDRAGDGHAITDLGSTNGTFVNGVQVRGHRALSAGDVIQIGPYRFVYTASGFSKSTTAGSVRVDGVRLRRVVGRGASTRVLLNDISISILPREFVALVGGSGAGKSTLMKAFAGIQRVDGEVLLNGDDLPSRYDAWKALMGYVPQDDIVHGDLTVDHAVRYAARLRLPRDTKRAELESAIERVLGDVEMLPHRDKLIRSLSGGQRKRVSIAVEMLSEPSLFFLDEPTSGLDPGLEKKMMYMMRRLADGGRTIVLVTHATANITQCDHVAFLSRGRLVWFGPPSEALEHFGVQDFSDIYSEIEKDPEGHEKRYLASKAHARCVVERQKALAGRTPAAGGAGAGRAPGLASTMLEKRTAGAIRQFWILTRRYAELVFRDRLLLGILLAVMPVIGLMLAAMARRGDLVGLAPEALQRMLASSRQELAHFAVVKDAEKLLFMAALAVVLLGLFGASYEIVKERPVYRRERMVNLRIGPYLLSKVVVLFLFALVQCGALLGALRLAVDIPVDGVLLPGPWEMYVTLVLTALAAILMGLFVSAITPNANTVIYLVLLAVFAQILLTGTIFALPPAAEPPSYAMVTRWSLEALGSTVDMDGLNRQTRMRFRRTIRMEQQLRAEDMGDALRPLMEQTGIPAPTVKVEKDIDEEIVNPAELKLRYHHDRNHLLFLWAGLAGFAAAFGVLTALTLSWRDRAEG